MPRLIRVGISLVLALAFGGCASTQVELKQWDELQNVQQSVTELRGYTSELESTVDSLTKIVARQDSALRVLVDFTGAQIPAYRPGYRGGN